MANNFDSNFTLKLAKGFLPAFESSRVMSKNVNTQMLDGKFNPASGTTTAFKRPTDYVSSRTPKGDLTAETASDITTGQALGIVQDYFTVFVDYDEADEALKMDELDGLLRPMAKRIVTDFELDFAAFMMKNSGLLAGDPGTPVTSWDHVAQAGAVLTASGIPADDSWYYTMNPYTQTNLASDQRSLGAGGAAGGAILAAHEKAMITSGFAGMDVMTGTTLASFLTEATGDTAGVVGSIDVTYVTAKDTMTQTIGVTGIGTFTGTVPAGTVIQITGRNRLNLNTRKPIIDGAGANVEFTAVVTADAAFTGGAGTLIVSGPGVFETGKAYNTTDSAIIVSDVITILNADSTLFQPNLFWHKQAFSVGSVPIKKLHSTDTLATTEDGLQFRVSKGSDWTKNSQQVRFDFRPAFAVLNPFFAGQGYGVA